MPQAKTQRGRRSSKGRSPASFISLRRPLEERPATVADRRPPGKAAAPIAHLMAPLPPAWRQTVTFDNETEFAQHHTLQAWGVETFFCDTHAPWQKGGIENAIGRLRRTLPRKTDLATLSDERFTRLVQAYNNTPRKCLGY